MKTRNNITNQAYFLARLRDNGYIADRLFANYGEHDPRAWTIVIDPGVASVFCTCLKNVDGLGTVHFELYDASQFVPQRFKINTDSLEVIISYLNELGIVNKSPKYNLHGPKRLWPLESADETNEAISTGEKAD